MQKRRIKATINYAFIEENFYQNRGLVLPGGTRSAKTISILQWIVSYCLKNTGKKIIIARDKMATLKDTTLTDFEAVCKGGKGCLPQYPGLHIFSRNSSPYTVINGNMIKFIGLNDDPYRTHGMDSDIFYINEAVGCLATSFKQLNQRANEGFILDCNPSEPNSWVYNLEKRKDVKFFRTNYEDNPFLNDEIIKEIEGYEPTHPEDRHLPYNERRPHPINVEQGTADARHWAIYGKGEIYKGPDIIYPDWDIYTDEQEPRFPDPEDPEDTATGYDHCFYGVDWGWNDPFVLNKLIINGRDLYIRTILYGQHITPEEYIERMKQEPLIAKKKVYVVCDNSEPKSIKGLQRAGIPAMAVKKYPGSVIDGIKTVKTYRIHIHEDSVAQQYEANNYKFKVDEATDTVTDIPIDKDNHGWDATRYPIQTFGRQS